MEQTKNAICFGGDLSNMYRPGEIARHSDTKILVLSTRSDFTIVDVIKRLELV